MARYKKSRIYEVASEHFIPDKGERDEAVATLRAQNGARTVMQVPFALLRVIMTLWRSRVKLLLLLLLSLSSLQVLEHPAAAELHGVQQ